MQLTDSSIAHLYTIPVASWTSINRRVGMVLLVQSIEKTIADQLPDFLALESACKDWSTGTFQALTDQSVALNTYAGEAIQNFSDLHNAVNALSGNTVPIAVQQQTTRTLNQLAAATKPLVANSSAIAQKVSAFMLVNKQIDAELLQYQSVLGTQWETLASITQAVDDATGLVNGAFQAINNDLVKATQNQVDVTMPFLEGLSIETAILAWKRIQSETAAFPSMANNQKQYWQPQNM